MKLVQPESELRPPSCTWISNPYRPESQISEITDSTPIARAHPHRIAPKLSSLPKKESTQELEGEEGTYRRNSLIHPSISISILLSISRRLFPYPSPPSPSRFSIYQSQARTLFLVAFVLVVALSPSLSLSAVQHSDSGFSLQFASWCLSHCIPAHRVHLP